MMQVTLCVTENVGAQSGSRQAQPDLQPTFFTSQYL